jgi:uncharacterized protein (DUF2344 family)
MTQSDNLPDRVSRAEDNIIDLRLAASVMLQAIDKNSANIAQLIELSRYNLEVSRRNSESIATLGAAIERMDRLLDYLMRRDQVQGQ